EHVVVDPHELAELREVPAHQREMVPVVQLADGADPVDAVAAAQAASQGVAGVRRIRDQSVRTDAIGHLGDGARLRVVGVHVEVLRHSPSLCPSRGRPAPTTPPVPAAPSDTASQKRSGGARREGGVTSPDWPENSERDEGKAEVTGGRDGLRRSDGTDGPSGTETGGTRGPSGAAGSGTAPGVPGTAGT